MEASPLPLREIEAIRAHSTVPLKTRWKPVDLVCDVDGEEVLVRTKFAWNPESLAVRVAEAVSHPALALMGFRMAEAYSVSVGQQFAADLSAMYDFDPPVLEGTHWGTRLMTADVQEVEFSEADVELLHDSGEVFRIFLGDVVLANNDRGTHGNILLGSRSRGSGLDLIPIDQSDAFHHPSALLNPPHLMAKKDAAGAKPLPGTEPMLVQAAPGFVAECFDRMSALRDSIVSCAGAAPGSWYQAAGVDPGVLEEFLDYRLANLDDLASRAYWMGIQDAAGGGDLVLNF